MGKFADVREPREFDKSSKQAKHSKSRYKVYVSTSVSWSKRTNSGIKRVQMARLRKVY
jgi:glutathionyl-hydroquinone reductase